MTSNTSLVASVRHGGWAKGTVDWLRIAAIGGLLLDLVTTGHILTNDTYIELNKLIDGLWTIHPAVGSAYLVGLYSAFAFVCTRQLGWFSTAFSGYIVVAAGVFAGLNNLELIVAGPPSMFGVASELFGTSRSAAFYASGFISIAGGFALARLRHGPLPWREVAVVTVSIVLVAAFANYAAVYTLNGAGI